MKSSNDPSLKSNKYDIVEQRPGVLFLGYPGLTERGQVMLIYGFNHRTLLEMLDMGILTGTAEQKALELRAAEAEEAERMAEFSFDEPKPNPPDWCELCPGMEPGNECPVDKNCKKQAAG